MKVLTNIITILRHRWRTLTMLAAVFFIIARYRYVLLAPALFAEDGIVFTKAAYDHGIFSLFHPYAGYFHLLSRSISYLAVNVLPINILPMTFLLATVAIVFFVFYEYLMASMLSPIVRIAVVLSLAILSGKGEDFLNLTNSHWFTSALYPLILLEPALKQKDRAISRSLLLFVIGMNDPLILVAFPFFAYRAWNNRGNRFEDLLFFVALAVFVAQFCCVIVSPPPHWQHFEPCPKNELVKYWFLAGVAQPIAIFVLGECFAKSALHSLPVLCCGVTVITLFVAICSFAVYNASALIKRVVVLFLFLSFFFYTSSIYRNILSPQVIVANGLSRYLFLPQVFLCAVVAACFSDRRSFLGRACCACMMFFVFAHSLWPFVSPVRFCADWGACMAELESNGSVTIPIAPDDSWTLHIESRGP